MAWRERLNSWQWSNTFHVDTHCVKYNASLFFSDFSCCMNLINSTLSRWIISPHTVTAKATKNIVPLCINSQMNNPVLQNYSITFKSWTHHWQKKKLTELNWTDLLWPSLNSNLPPGLYGFKLLQFEAWLSFSRIGFFLIFLLQKRSLNAFKWRKEWYFHLSATLQTKL